MNVRAHSMRSIRKAYPADIGRRGFAFRRVCAMETTVTEEVSLHGARVTTVWRWQPGTRVLVTFLWDGVRSEGRLAYCQCKESGDFAIGVELSGQVQSRMGSLT